MKKKDRSKEQVFDFTSYRDYLYFALGKPGQRTGMRMKACRFLGCHTTYLSQVLSERAHLSLEHAEALSRFLRHTKDESDYFFNLVLFDRASTKALKDRIVDQLAEIAARRNIIKSRVNESSEISAADQDKFYSHWIYTAIHVLVSIPSLQNAEALALAMGLSKAATQDALDFLQRIGIVSVKDGHYIHGTQVLHLGADSALIAKHHTNWRFHTIQSLSRARAEDLHYSAGLSLTKSVAQKIRDNILATLQDNIDLVKAAPAEEAYIYSFDFYRMA